MKQSKPIYDQVRGIPLRIIALRSVIVSSATSQIVVFHLNQQNLLKGTLEAKAKLNFHNYINLV